MLARFAIVPLIAMALISTALPAFAAPSDTTAQLMELGQTKPFGPGHSHY